MGYPASNEIFSKAMMDALIATINGEEAPEAIYPAYNELPSKEQGDALIEAVDSFISEHGGGDLPDVTASDNGKALVVKNGAWAVDNVTHPQGAAVADAAGEAPTAAEFKALLDSLRNAGVIATASVGS